MHLSSLHCNVNMFTQLEVMCYRKYSRSAKVKVRRFSAFCNQAINRRHIYAPHLKGIPYYPDIGIYKSASQIVITQCIVG